MEKFQIQSLYKPSGDQPLAIEKICQGIEKDYKDQVLLGVTGSGKTFTIANVINKIQKPALVFAPNKISRVRIYLFDITPKNKF